MAAHTKNPAKSWVFCLVVWHSFVLPSGCFNLLALCGKARQSKKLQNILLRAFAMGLQSRLLYLTELLRQVWRPKSQILYVKIPK